MSPAGGASVNVFWGECGSHWGSPGSSEFPASADLLRQAGVVQAKVGAPPPRLGETARRGVRAEGARFREAGTSRPPSLLVRLMPTAKGHLVALIPALALEPVTQEGLDPR